MGALLALASAVCYGIADYAGGLLSRRAHFSTVALVGQAGGLALTVITAPFVPAPGLAGPDIGWGVLSGVGTGVGMLFLYRGLSRGAMTVVVPVSAVGGVVLPVLIGVALLGDRPSALSWLGIAAAVSAIWLAAQTRPRDGAMIAPATMDALFASLGITVQYAALAQASATAGLWPIAAGRLAATAVILPFARDGGRPWRPHAIPAAAIGVVAALALTCYMLATRVQLLSIAVVLASLYPVIPVVLGIMVLRERLSLPQSAGIAAAAIAIGLLVAG